MLFLSAVMEVIKIELVSQPTMVGQSRTTQVEIYLEPPDTLLSLRGLFLSVRVSTTLIHILTFQTKNGIFSRVAEELRHIIFLQTYPTLPRLATLASVTVRMQHHKSHPMASLSLLPVLSICQIFTLRLCLWGHGVAAVGNSLIPIQDITRGLWPQLHLMMICQHLMSTSRFRMMDFQSSMESKVIVTGLCREPHGTLMDIGDLHSTILFQPLQLSSHMT
mmetsp:Transcript_6805/g.12118  ORF Transcript_6805/g.12118 Transcript_6805/m.12118 type:complete len:220 (+) Transcript_6805:343-1002(+)